MQEKPEPSLSYGADADVDMADFGLRVRRMREARNLTLAQLAEASQVSRAMISKVERGEASPTIGVAKRVARALATSLSYLAGAEQPHRALVVTHANERAVFRDASTGFERQVLSPPSRSGVELLLHVLPVGATTGPLPAPPRGTEKHLLVVKGDIAVTIDDRVVPLTAGDTLFFEADIPHGFTNIGTSSAEYVVFITQRPG